MENIFFIQEGGRISFSDGVFRKGFFVKKKGSKKAVDFCESQEQAEKLCDKYNGL